MALHPAFICKCHIPSPRQIDGEDSGLCTCGGVYDERLYTMRLRQHQEGIPEGMEDLDEILHFLDPDYYREVTSTKS